MFLIDNLSYISEYELLLEARKPELEEPEDDYDEEDEPLPDEEAPRTTGLEFEGIKRVILYHKLKDLLLIIKKSLVTLKNDEIRSKLYDLCDLMNVIIYYYNVIPYESALSLADNISSILEDLFFIKGVGIADTINNTGNNN